MPRHIHPQSCKLSIRQLYRRRWTDYLIQKLIGVDPIEDGDVNLTDVLLLERTRELRRRLRFLKKNRHALAA